MDEARFATSRTIGQWTFWSVFAVLLIVLLCGLAVAAPWTETGTSSTTTRSTTGPSSTTEIEESVPAASAAASPEPPVRTETRTESDGSSSEVVVSSTAPADTSAVARALSNPAAPILIAILAALIVAFLLAAAAQRAHLGSYGIKVGPVEIPELVLTKDDAAAAADRIGRSDVGGAGIAALSVLRWWTEEPSPNADVRASFLYQRSAVEAAAREFVRLNRQPTGQADLLDVNDIIRWLSDFLRDGDFIDGLSRIIALGDRIRAGAVVEPDAEVALRAAFSDAIRRMAVLVAETEAAQAPT